jgi:protease-4
VANSDEILRDVLFATIKEQRAKRRWSIFFRLIFLVVFLVTVGMLYFPSDSRVLNPSAKGNYAALVDINGIIDANSRANADNIISGIDDAFKDSDVKGIILRIDSPGGTPVQASEIYNEILRQRVLHPHIKIYAVCTDMCTSAAYYIASATDAIYANPSSLVGSIGVLMESFGFTDAIQKLGVQRRLFISGDRKGFLDPFSPLKPEDQKAAQDMLDEVHQQFIHDVMKGRGERLKINPETFSGLVWTGREALPQGIIDGFGSATQIAREIIKTEDVVDFTVKPNPFDLFAQRIGASFASHLGTLLTSEKMN